MENGGDGGWEGELELGPGRRTPERYLDRCSCTVLYGLEELVLNGLDVERRHDCASVLKAARGAKPDNWRHCDEKKCECSYLRERENFERRDWLGTKDLDMVTTLSEDMG
jgi:hypothetical protein